MALLKPPKDKDEDLQQSLVKEIKSFQSEIARPPGLFKENKENMTMLMETRNALNSKIN